MKRLQIDHVGVLSGHGMDSADQKYGIIAKEPGGEKKHVHLTKEKFLA